MLAGGSNDDNLITDIRLTSSGNHVVFPHNKALAMVKDWKEGRGNYKLKRTGSGFKITSVGDDYDFIEISDEHGKTGNKSSESTVTIGKELIKDWGNGGASRPTNAFNKL